MNLALIDYQKHRYNGKPIDPANWDQFIKDCLTIIECTDIIDRIDSMPLHQKLDNFGNRHIAAYKRKCAQLRINDLLARSDGRHIKPSSKTKNKIIY